VCITSCAMAASYTIERTDPIARLPIEVRVATR
jgi:hypothetical protein